MITDQPDDAVTSLDHLRELGFKENASLTGAHAENCKVTIEFNSDQYELYVHLPNGNIVGCIGPREAPFGLQFVGAKND